MRLWHRIAFLSTFSIVLTVILVVTIQSAYLDRAVRQFNPAFQDVITELQTTPNLGQAERLELFRTALLRTADDPAEFKQYVTQLSKVLDMQRRLPRLAALISLLVVLPIAAGVAWLISQPIRGVSKAATQIAKGELGARIAPSWQASGKRDELTELAHSFNGMAETLERLDHERREMIVDLAHELRTPLAILQGQIDAMREGVRPLTQGALEKLGDQTQRLGKLIDDLRTLSLAEAGRLSLEPIDVALVPFVERLVDSFSEVAAKSSISLTFRTSLENGVKLKADPNRLKQALYNLVENALQHTPAMGSVEVSVSKQEKKIEISVKDSGPSLSSDEELTQTFRQPYRTELSCMGSSSLGFAITRTLVELHGGHIEAAIQSTGGNVFTILLPA